MSLITAFFRLIRWPNLFFIALTQFLFQTCIYYSIYDSVNERQLIWVIVASVLIAAAGYIINDYFDINIDQINKPDKNVINTVISRRWAIFWHLALSGAGILATILAVSLSNWHIIGANVPCAILLWLYSTAFKRQLLIGNVVISLLTAWTVLILFFANVPLSAAFGGDYAGAAPFFRRAFLYAGFAFITSLIREAIKDMEDRDGDERYGCKTLPIVAGYNATKIYVAVWLVVLIAALVVLQLYILQFEWYLAIVYSLLLLIVPSIYILVKLYRANRSTDFAHLSAVTKFVMLTGILSMFFFRIYH